jgi:hypothetical protein
VRSIAWRFDRRVAVEAYHNLLLRVAGVAHAGAPAAPASANARVRASEWGPRELWRLTASGADARVRASEGAREL